MNYMQLVGLRAYNYILSMSPERYRSDAFALLLSQISIS